MNERSTQYIITYYMYMQTSTQRYTNKYSVTDIQTQTYKCTHTDTCTHKEKYMYRQKS